MIQKMNLTKLCGLIHFKARIVYVSIYIIVTIVAPEALNLYPKINIKVTIVARNLNIKRIIYHINIYL